MDSFDRERSTQPATPASHLGRPGRLEGHLLDRVRGAYREAAEFGDPRHAPFLIAVGALAVYGRACRVPVAELLRELEHALSLESLPETTRHGERPEKEAARALLWAEAEQTAIQNYSQPD